MKRTYLIILAAALIAGSALTLGLTVGPGSGDGSMEAVNTAQAEPTTPAESLYVCAMHPWESSDEPGSCTTCGMALSEVKGFTAGDPVPSPDELFIQPDDPMTVSAVRHDGWIPITESPYYQPREHEKPAGHDGFMEEGAEHVAGKLGDDPGETAAKPTDTGDAPSGTLWTCGMHPNVIQNEPGNCPICHMELVPLKQGAATSGGATVSIDPVTLQNIGVVTESAERRNLSREIRSNGTVVVAEENEVKVNARVSGWVEKLYVSRTGDRVTKGEPLLEVYSPELLAAQEEYIVALQNSDALKSSSLGHVSRSGSELAEAARRRLQLWNITDAEIDRLAQTREVRRTLPLVAPASGIVLEKHVVEGAAIKPGMDLFSIADLDRIWVKAQVYEYELPWVREGNAVHITSPYDPDFHAMGAVDYIYPTVDSKSRTVDVRIVLANPNLDLRPDMYVDVHIESSPRQDVVAVPKSAVIRSGERDIVFVSKGGGEFEPREVELGLETDRHYEIAHNLTPGDQVVTSAQFLLDSEAKLQEAIQRRIAGRSGAEDADAQAEAVAMAGGHQH
ncbi:MAG: Cation efflux system protein CusB [Calditrichaeota bacterium]|nr:Cation efflux system protein CusB [Calditrichota bacterium]